MLATEEDLANWLTAAPPPNSAALLRRAESIIRRLTVTAVYDVDSTGTPTKTSVREAMRDAICAQAEAWIAAGLDPAAGAAGAAAGTVASSSIGGGSVTYASTAAAARADAVDRPATQAVDLLLDAGLLGGRVTVR